MVDTDRITGAAKDIGGRVQSAVGDLTGSKSDSVEGRFREAQGTAENLYGQAKDAVRHAADEAYDYAEDAYEQGRRTLREGHERSTEWPHTSLVVAGLVGFGLGLLVSKL
ncbi:CsbD family protein [Methylobacterium sp. Leaf118]|uniref:CsbD family protein n=1 Tax=Methylobacterium sp. Leaf118 TaxID=2876562 RepID=UPI001E2C1F22|nr:CsbD family protein [Methylobacterium sp. Leaf118]